MKTKRLAAILVSLVFSGVLILTGFAKTLLVIPPQSLRNARWVINRIDKTPDVSEHVAISVEPVTGQIFVSYYDAAGKDLYLTIFDGKAGNCGPANMWHCHKLVSSGDVGMYNSIDTIHTLNGVKFIITYYDATNHGLYYILGNNVSSGLNWNRYKVQSSLSVLSYYGKYTSVKFNTKELIVAHYVGNGTGNCGTGIVLNKWQCDVVASGKGVGYYASLDIDANGKPSVAYYHSTNKTPVVVSYTGSLWVSRSVKQNTLDTGKFVSLYVENNGTPHIAYQNVTSSTLEYAGLISAPAGIVVSAVCRCTGSGSVKKSMMSVRVPSQWAWLL